MAALKGKLKVIGLIAIGFVIGAVIATGFISWQYFKVFRSQYYSGIMSNTNTAYMISAGREEDLLKNIEINTRQCVLASNAWQWQHDSENRLHTLWQIQRYYQKFDLPVPVDIKPTLDALPPRPLTSCELNRLDQPDTDQSEE